MLVVTSNDVPGFEIAAVYGEVFGLTVRAMPLGTAISAGVRAMGGGEIPEMSRLLAECRSEAMSRMVELAKTRGANAIVAMRFDTGSVQQLMEVCAYGTAVWVAPVTDFAKENFKKLVE
jgi:uncharacterized protein YbjQ (UPF0145 family)